MITFVGDVHGKFSEFSKILQTEKNVVQVGDLGVGFRSHDALLPYDFRFIHGNHDNPDLCYNLPGFLGRFGYQTGKFFFVSGAYSIDQKYRHIGVDWWANEELGYSEGLLCLELYDAVRPEIVVSHDCPINIYRLLLSHHAGDNTRTNNLLQAMFEVHQPKVWIFGHHHTSLKIDYFGTKFICLAELEKFVLDK